MLCGLLFREFGQWNPLDLESPRNMPVTATMCVRVSSRPDAVEEKRKLRIDDRLVIRRRYTGVARSSAGLGNLAVPRMPSSVGKTLANSPTVIVPPALNHSAWTFPSSSVRAQSPDVFKDEFVQVACDIALHCRCLRVPILAMFHAICAISWMRRWSDHEARQRGRIPIKGDEHAVRKTFQPGAVWHTVLQLAPELD
jgi:hypothetical protein